MLGKPINPDLSPIIERVSFSNTKLEKLERGDILYFSYSGSRDDTIINPCIIFSGLNKKTGLIEGVNMRMFYVEKMLPIGNAVFNKYQDIYWDTVENEETGEVTFEKKKVKYFTPTAFMYETLDLYTPALINKLMGIKRVKVNLLKQYWRTYQPIKMGIIKDEFSKLTQNNISINFDVANAIIRVPPTQLTIQPRLEE